MLAAPPPTICAAPSDPIALLSENRRAVVGGQAVQNGTLTSRYSYEASGMSGTTVRRSDLATGDFTIERNAGPFRGSNGFDGVQAWQSDLSGFPSSQDGGNIRALAVNEAYRMAQLWWRQGAGGARLSRVGCGGIVVEPKGGLAFQAWFDPRTDLLLRIVEPGTYGATVETTFSDYRRLGGRMTAMRIQTVTNGDRSSLETQNLEDTSIGSPRSASAYSMPRFRPADWTLPSNGRTSLPFRIINNHVIVDVLVNGSGPYPFLVDTGGHDIITPATLKSLALTSEGASPTGGAGDKTVNSGFARIDTLSIGDAVLHGQTMMTLDFSPQDVEGIRLGGMLGAEFMERFVVRIDYGAKVMTIIDRALPGAVGEHAGTAVRFQLYGHMPQVKGDFDGRVARFDIDTGARGEVTLTSPFVRNAGLRNAYPEGTTLTDGWGVGGPSKSYVVRARTLRIGNVTVARPLASLSLAAKGSFSDANYEGNIGSGLLKRFAVTFDYAKLTLYLMRLEQPDEDVGRFDRAGMWINRAAQGVEIMDLAAGGPAQSAGLRIGEVITSIDGFSTATSSLSDVRRSLKLLPLDRSVVIAYTRAGVAATAVVRPRNLVPD